MPKKTKRKPKKKAKAKKRPRKKAPRKAKPVTRVLEPPALELPEPALASASGTQQAPPPV